MPLDYEQLFFFLCLSEMTHGSKWENEYTIEFFRLADRNQLPKNENQPKALQVEGRNFLTIVHDPSSLWASVRRPEKRI